MFLSAKFILRSDIATIADGPSMDRRRVQSSKLTVMLMACCASALMAITATSAVAATKPAQIFVRFRILDPPGDKVKESTVGNLGLEPPGSKLKITTGGYTHVKDWHLPRESLDVAVGEWSRWLDLRQWPLHGRMNRSGGVAEWPAMKLMLSRLGKKPEPIGHCELEVQLADQPDPQHVVISFKEQGAAGAVTFLLPHPLREKQSEFETASQMAARHLAWAKAATGGHARTLQNFDVITSVWGERDPVLAEQAIETLKLLGFNVVSGVPVSVSRAVSMRTYAGMGGLTADPEQIVEAWQKRQALQSAKVLSTEDGRWTRDHTAHYVIGDEIQTLNFIPPPINKKLPAAVEARRAKIGVDPGKLNGWFREYLRRHGETDGSLGKPLAGVEYPAKAMYEKTLPRDADLPTRKIAYYAGKFGQWWSAKQLRQLTDLVKQARSGPLPTKTETLPADHPFFGSAGPPRLGMGYRGLDFFELGAQQAVDILSAEDWLGLNHMYGPGYTWTGAPAFGYLSGIYRSGIGDGNVALRALITPSDDGYLRLKAYTALGQGAKSFFFWTFGPTCIGTENYWSDLRSEYDGIARLTAALEKAEKILYPARPVRDPVAILYSVSHDLWHTDDPASFVENRLTWTALRHLSIQPDFLREEDLEAGRLAGYKVLYITGQCLTRKAAQQVDDWIRQGGVAYLTAGACTRDEFYEPYLPAFAATVWPADAALGLVSESGHHFNERGDLPTIQPLTHAKVTLDGRSLPMPVIGVRLNLKEGIAPAALWASFEDGKPAAARVGHGKGTVIGIGFLPGLAYSPFTVGQKTLDETWPQGPLSVIAKPLSCLSESRTLAVSQPVVEASLLTGTAGSAIVLVNHTYKSIANLRIGLASIHRFSEAVSTEGVKVTVTRTASGAELNLPLDWTDIILLSK